MGPLLGMVGFAEGLWSQMIGELCLGTFVVAILALVALVFRSRVAAIASLMVDVFVALLYFPWEAFAAASNDDTDWQSILAAWRTVARWWVGISVAALLSALWVFLRPVAGPPRSEHSTPEEEKREQDAARDESRITVIDNQQFLSGPRT